MDAAPNIVRRGTARWRSVHKRAITCACLCIRLQALCSFQPHKGRPNKSLDRCSSRCRPEAAVQAAVPLQARFQSAEPPAALQPAAAVCTTLAPAGLPIVVTTTAAAAAAPRAAPTSPQGGRCLGKVELPQRSQLPSPIYQRVASAQPAGGAQRKPRVPLHPGILVQRRQDLCHVAGADGVGAAGVGAGKLREPDGEVVLPGRRAGGECAGSWLGTSKGRLSSCRQPAGGSTPQGHTLDMLPDTCMQARP